MRLTACFTGYRAEDADYPGAVVWETPTAFSFEAPEVTLSGVIVRASARFGVRR